ncbi:MAG: hypothetical protein HZB13_18945 [Acidobacteria bacterium]|nr:hypothetical protein [Acidobacteriota bacterium]
MLLAVVLFASPAPAQDPPAWQPLLEEINRIAPGEPPVLGIDTQIRAAALLAPGHPKEARLLLQDAVSRILTLPDLSTRGAFVLQVAQSVRDLDPAEIESVCLLLPRRPPGAGEDPLSSCMSTLFSGSKITWDARKDFVRRALAGGAFGALTAAHLDDARRNHPAEAAAEYAALIDGFPTSDATAAEVEQLLRVVEMMRGSQVELSRRALDNALRALRRPRFPSPPNLRDALLARASTLAGVVTPKPDQPLTWDKLPKFEPPREKKRNKDDDEKDIPTDGLTSDEIVALARRQSSMNHAAMLIELVDKAKDADKELPLSRRVALASEALDASVEMKLRVERLLVQSMLTRRLYEYGEIPKAVLGAQLLAETFQKMYDCESAGCLSFQGDDSPGDLIYSFAEYLREHGIRPEDLGLSNRSLTARMILLDLEYAVKGKKRKFGLFGTALP